MLASPGVEEVSYTDFVPLSTTAGPWNYVKVDGYTPAQGEASSVNRALVSPGYFATMRIPILEGRDFTLRDDRKGEPVMIVNQAFAKRYFRGQSPLGRKVRTYDVGPEKVRGGVRCSRGRWRRPLEAMQLASRRPRSWAR